MRRDSTLLVFGLVLAMSLFSAQAAERVALVIGNSNYQNTPALANPGNDATDMAALLEGVGFTVTRSANLERIAFEDALAEFGREAQKAQVALVFYAGHGIQVGGRNYLMPTDVRLRDERDLRRLIELDDMIYEASQARDLGLVIIDACRDNPLAQQLARGLGRQRSATIGRGFARVDNVPTDTLIGFATEAGSTADDGSGRNSPYTAALKQHLATPGVDIGVLFRRVRASVMDKTSGRQRPLARDGLTREFKLVSAQPVPNAITPPVVPEPERVRLAVKPTPSEAQVRIMNIVSRYVPGIALEVGRYEIEVSHPGFKPHREWYELTMGDQVLAIELEPQIKSQVTKPTASLSNNPAQHDDSFSDISGGWTLRNAKSPNGRIVSRINILQLHNQIRVNGTGDWTGKGVFDGQKGYYDWLFNSGRPSVGKSGRTSFVLRPDGRLYGEVKGSKSSWSFVATKD